MSEGLPRRSASAKPTAEPGSQIRSQVGRSLALVTGASSGIGREIARHLAADGYDLLLVARREDRLRELGAELEAGYGTRMRIFPIDLTERDAVDRVVEYIDQEQLEIDMLVNNAGVGSVGSFHEVDRDLLLDMIQLNVIALTDLTRRLIPGMIQRRQGRILNVSSSAAFQPAPLMGAYHATKSFVLFLTEAISEELRGTGVTATALCPGPVGQTEFGDHTGTDNKVPFLGIVRVDASKVARLGIDGAIRGKTIVVPGLLMRLSSWISPRLPRWLVRKITHLIQLSRTASTIFPR